MPTLAENGAQAVDMAGGPTTTLILMDMQMPVMDGLEATLAIRGTERGYADPGDDRQCLRRGPAALPGRGMNDHVAKPVDPDILFAALLRWLPLPTRAVETPASQEKQATDDAGFIAQLDTIAGMDTALGLRMVRQRVGSYRRLIRLYAESHQATSTPARLSGCGQYRCRAARRPFAEGRRRHDRRHRHAVRRGDLEQKQLRAGAEGSGARGRHRSRRLRCQPQPVRKALLMRTASHCPPPRRTRPTGDR